MEIIYAADGVLAAQGHAPVAISAVYQSEDGKHLTFEGNTDRDTEWPVENLNIFPSSGTIYFRSQNVQYSVREIREEDGEWMSKYQMPLSYEALGALISVGGQSVAGENFMAVATDQSPYVVGLLYNNGSGTYARQDSEWVLVADNDTTYEDMIPMPIRDDKAAEFLALYDENYVSVSDAQEYESPQNSAATVEA